MENARREIQPVEFTSKGNFWGWEDLDQKGEKKFMLSADSRHMLCKWNIALAKRQVEQAGRSG